MWLQFADLAVQYWVCLHSCWEFKVTLLWRWTEDSDKTELLQPLGSSSTEKNKLQNPPTASRSYDDTAAFGLLLFFFLFWVESAAADEWPEALFLFVLHNSGWSVIMAPRRQWAETQTAKNYKNDWGKNNSDCFQVPFCYILVIPALRTGYRPSTNAGTPD